MNLGIAIIDLIGAVIAEFVKDEVDDLTYERIMAGVRAKTSDSKRLEEEVDAILQDIQ